MSDDDEQTYSIIRFFQDQSREREVIETGLTLEEAQEHCEDPETSSKTCMSTEGLTRTQEVGEWFDGFHAE